MTIKLNQWVEVEITFPATKFAQQTGKTNSLVFSGEIVEIHDNHIVLHNGKVVSHKHKNVKLTILNNVISIPKHYHF